MLPLISAMLIPLPTLFFTLLMSLKQTTEDNRATVFTWTQHFLISKRKLQSLSKGEQCVCMHLLFYLIKCLNMLRNSTSCYNKEGAQFCFKSSNVHPWTNSKSSCIWRSMSLWVIHSPKGLATHWCVLSSDTKYWHLAKWMNILHIAIAAGSD